MEVVVKGDQAQHQVVGAGTEAARLHDAPKSFFQLGAERGHAAAHVAGNCHKCILAGSQIAQASGGVAVRVGCQCGLLKAALV